MGARYPDQVGGHKPCVPIVVIAGGSPFGTVYYFGHDGGRLVFGRHGATHDLAQWGVSRSGRESVMAVDRVCRNVVGPPEWECEAMGSMVWVKCTTSAKSVF